MANCRMSSLTPVQLLVKPVGGEASPGLQSLFPGRFYSEPGVSGALVRPLQRRDLVYIGYSALDFPFPIR